MRDSRPKPTPGARAASSRQGAAGRAPPRALSCRTLLRFALLPGDANPEMRPGAIEDLDHPAMQRHVFLHDGKPQAAALDRGGGRFRAAVERLEHLLALVLRDAGAFVEHLQHRVAVLLVELDGDEPALGRI